MPQPRLYRRSEGKLVAGVAGGLADHLGLNPLVVRVAFVALTPVNGLGAVLYAVFWAAVRQVSPAQDRPPPNARQRAEASGQLVAFAAIAAGLLLFLPRIGLGGNSLLAWPVAAAVVGGALIWRQADESAQVRWERLVGGQGANRRDAVLRIAIGVVLVAGGLISALAATGNLVAARDGLLTTGVMVAGVAVVTGPWWWRTWQDLATERRERIRSQDLPTSRPTSTTPCCTPWR